MQGSHRLSVWIGLSLCMAVISGCGSKPAPNHAHTTSSRGVNTRQVQSAGGGRKPAHAIKPYSSPPAKLPAGSVSAGSRVYAATCASCHGIHATGTLMGPRLAHPSNIVSHFTSETALEVFIAHNMPANNPGILTTKDAVNVAQYIWHIAK